MSQYIRNLRISSRANMDKPVVKVSHIRFGRPLLMDLHELADDHKSENEKNDECEGKPLEVFIDK